MEQWRPNRRPSQMRVTMQFGGMRRDVRLLDVSENGLKVACPDGPPPDTEVEIWTPRIARSGRIRWADRGALGVILSTPLSSAEQAELAGMSWGY